MKNPRPDARVVLLWNTVYDLYVRTELVETHGARKIECNDADVWLYCIRMFEYW